MSETQRDRAPGVPGVLDAVRDGWHSLGGGDAAACPGCPVCRLSESAGRMDPDTAEHLQQAVTHVVAAGRELLAALARPGRPAEREPHGRSSTAGTRTPGTSTAGAGRAAEDRLADPPDPSVPTRTRIPVDTPPTRPLRGNEEQE